jgi:hypothetical protein
LASLLAVAGCSSTPNTGAPDTSPSLASRLSSYFTGGGAKPAASPATATATAVPPSIDCPGVDIRQGAGMLNIAAKPGGDATAGDLRYQLSFHQFARECSVADGLVTIKVGVQGRIIVGPQGGPGQVDAPIRYAVVREGPEPKVIVTRFKRVPVTLAPGDTNVAFTDVEGGLTFPMPPAAELEAYVVYVGFDEIGEKPAPKTTPARNRRSPKT